MKMKNLLFCLLFLSVQSIFAQEEMPVIDVVYNGASATVSIPDNVKDVYVQSAPGSPNVSLFANNSDVEYCFRLSGSTNAGSFLIQGGYKMTIELAGVSLTSTTGAAFDVECGKRIAVVLADGTVNNFTDNTFGTHKATMYFTGHPEFEGGGTLNVTGHVAHAISAKEYIELKEDLGTINVLSATKDGIHCGKGKVNNENNYFEMKGGTVNIANVKSDCIDSDDYGCIKIKGGVLNLSVTEMGGSALKCDSVFSMRDGDININLLAQDAEGIRCNYEGRFKGGDIRITNSGVGSKGIKMKTEKTGTVLSGGNAIFSGTDVKIDVCGGTLVTADDVSRCMGISVDGNMTLTDGDIVLHRNNDQAKSHNVKGELTITDSGRILLDGNHYTANTAYQHDMTVYAKAKVLGNANVDYANYHLAAFVGDECRGEGEIFLVRDGYAYVCLRVFGTEGEDVSYHLYDASDGAVLFASETHRLSNNATVGMPSAPTILSFELTGDVNRDGRVTISDLTALINMLNGHTNPNYDSGAADANKNGTLDLGDIKTIQNILQKQ